MLDRHAIYLILILLIIFFYAGASISPIESNLFYFIKDFSSFLASLATIIGVYVAYKALQIWSKPITEPSRYQSDVDGVTSISSQLYDFLFFIQSTANDIEFLNTQLSEETYPKHRNFLPFDGSKNLIYEIGERSVFIYKNIQSYHSSTVNSLQINALNKFSHPFLVYEPLPPEVVSYRKFVAEILLDLMKHASETRLRAVHNLEFCDPQKKYCLPDFGPEGLIENQLHQKFKAISEHYAKKWNISGSVKN
ncbi:TPA: hypothetical protein ACGUW9_000981 [Vibrio vulnificus]|uniref:hypothetical protein n=1 Tax=Vibrio vulnificus TaxID=672 RepID=UPI0032EF6C5E